MVSESAVPWNPLGCTGMFSLKKLHTNNTFVAALKRSNITDFKGGTPANSQCGQTERFQSPETAGSNGSKRETSVSQEEGQKQEMLGLLHLFPDLGWKRRGVAGSWERAS